MPPWRAFGAGRGVATIWEAAGVAETHGNDGDAGRVVELLAIQVQPRTQSVTGCVVPGDAGFMDFGSRRLADDEQSRGFRHPKDRARAEREVRGADRAGAGCFRKTCEV